MRKDYMWDVFWKLTVVDVFEDNNSIRYVVCDCSCWWSCTRKLSNLISSKSKWGMSSCELCNMRMNDFSLYIWQKFNKLTITWFFRKDVVYKSKTSEPYFIYRCECWNEWSTNVHHIFRWQTKSCWCLKKAAILNNSMKIYPDGFFLGKRHGMLEVVWERYKQSNHITSKWRKRIFICRCDCWKEKEMSPSNFNKTWSCWCNKHKRIYNN